MTLPRFRYEQDSPDGGVSVKSFDVYDNRRGAGSKPICCLNNRDTAEMIVHALNRAETTPEDTAEQFIQAAIDSAPEPLKRLGRFLSDVLDEDRWKTAEAMLLAIAVSKGKAE